MHKWNHHRQYTRARSSTSFISSWGDINISTKNSKACIKTIKATTIDNEILIVIDAIDEVD